MFWKQRSAWVSSTLGGMGWGGSREEMWRGRALWIGSWKRGRVRSMWPSSRDCFRIIIIITMVVKRRSRLLCLFWMSGSGRVTDHSIYLYRLVRQRGGNSLRRLRRSVSRRIYRLQETLSKCPVITRVSRATWIKNMKFIRISSSQRDRNRVSSKLDPRVER